MAGILTRGWDEPSVETRGWDAPLPGLDQEQSDALLKADREGRPFEVTVDNGRMSENKVDGQPMTPEAANALEAAKYAQAFGEQHAVDVGMEAAKPAEKETHDIPTGDVLIRAAKAAGFRAEEYAGMPMAGFGLMLDKLNAAFRELGLPLAETDYATTEFGRMSRLGKSAELQAPQPGEKFANVVQEGVFRGVEGLGKLAPSFIEGAPLGAGFRATTESAVPAVNALRDLASGPVANAVREAGPNIITAVPAATQTAAERYKQLIDAGEDPERAAILAAGTGVETLGQMAVPLSAGGSLPSRMGQGAVGGAALAAGGTALENEAIDLTGANPNLKQNPFDAATLIAAAVPGAVFGAMGHERDPLDTARPILQARSVDDAIAAAERAINEPEPAAPAQREPAASEPPTLDLSQALPEETPPPSPAELQTGRIAQAADEAIARRAQNDRAAELAQPIEPDEALRAAQTTPAERPLRSQAEIVQERLDAEERARNAQETQQAIARGEGAVQVPGGPQKPAAGRTVQQMTVPELDAILRLTRSADRRAEITAEILRRAQEGRAQPQGLIVPEERTNALEPSAGEADAVQERSAEALPVREAPGGGEGVRGSDTTGGEAAGARVEGDRGQLPQEAPVAAEATNVAENSAAAAEFQDFTTPKGEVKTFTTQKMAQAFVRQNPKVPRNYAPRQVARGQWVLSRAKAAPEAVERPVPRAEEPVAASSESVVPERAPEPAAAPREAPVAEQPTAVREPVSAEPVAAESEGRAPMFSRGGGKQLVDMLGEYAKRDDAFRYPKSDAESIHQLAKDYDLESAGFRASDKLRPYQMRGPHGMDTEHHRLPVIEIRDKGGNYKPYLEMQPDPRSPEDTVIIRINDFDHLPRGVEGSRVYQAAMAWAINNKFHLNPDTDLLPVNRLRRNEAMISTYLKYGDKANVIAPHREQFIGLLPDREYNAIRSKKTGFDGDTGNFTQGVERDLERIKNRLWKATPEGASPEQRLAIWRSNLHNLVVASEALAHKRAPALNDIRINDAGEFENGATGQRTPLGRLEHLGDLGLPPNLREAGIGFSTVRRSVYAAETRRRMRAQESGNLEGAQSLQSVARPEERPDLLVEGAGRGIPVDEGTARVLTAALGDRAFYAREGEARFRRGPESASGLTHDQFRSALSDAFGEKAADRLIGKAIVPIESQAELPDHVVPFVREGDTVFGFYDPKTDKTYAVLENLSPEMVRGLAMHEVGVHYGFERMLGEKRYGQVMRQLDLMARAGNKDVKAARVIAEREAADPSQVAEETLAYLVQNRPEMSFVKRIVSEIKAFLFREFGIGKLTADDMATIARASVMRAAKGEGPRMFTEPAFSRAGPKRPDWIERGPEALKRAASKIDTYAAGESFQEKIKALKATWKDRLVQGVFDAYAPLKKLGPKEYMLARMVKASDGALEGMLLYGKPEITDSGVIRGQIDRKGFLGAMQDLKGEHDRFFLWVAGNRAERLMGEGREHLFTADEVQAMKGLIRGHMADGRSRPEVYAKAGATLRAYNKAVLDIAEKTGLIDGEARHLWEHDYYVPFFRVDEDAKIDGPGTKVKGLVRQQAFKKLKGGTDNLGDLMANTLRNWSHLISASMANQAAVANLKAAVKVGIARELTKQEIAADAVPKDATYAMVDGKKTYYEVSDPFVMTAISAMESASFKGLPMKVLGKFKHYLTLGVTVSPTFRVRNLIRDTIAALGQNEISYNVTKNLMQGFKGTDKSGETYGQMLFNGAMMRFGYLTDGKHAEHAKRLIEAGVDGETILTSPEKVKAAVGKLWDEWQELGDRMENVNRAALYQQLKADGKSDLEAAFAARDMMDFSLQGSWVAVRFLSQIVPFQNARLQGLYKLGRATVENPQRAGYVMGAVALASAALLLAYQDDPEWKKRPDWDRDTYWWFRIGNTAYRIPKPFEIGAIGTLAERSLELAISDEMTGKRFADRLRFMLSQTFQMSVVPQAFGPLFDLYANQDSFSGRLIESQSMQGRTKPERATPNTSALARVLGRAGETTGVSPVQIDYLLRSYFGWLGSHIAMASDVVAQPFLDSTKPARKIDDYFVIGDFVKGLPANQSRYVDDFYKQAQTVQQIMGDIRQAREAHDAEKVREIMQEHRADVALSHLYSNAQRRMSFINRRVKQVTASSMDPDDKRAELDRLTTMRNELARVVEQRATERRRAAGE